MMGKSPWDGIVAGCKSAASICQAPRLLIVAFCFKIDLVIPRSGNSGLLALPRLSGLTSQEDGFLPGVDAACGFFFEPATADCHFQQTT